MIGSFIFNFSEDPQCLKKSESDFFNVGVYRGLGYDKDNCRDQAFTTWRADLPYQDKMELL